VAEEKRQWAGMMGIFGKLIVVTVVCGVCFCFVGCRRDPTVSGPPEKVAGGSPGGGELERCVPQCEGKDCGPDGCGGVCGELCDSDLECVDGFCIGHECDDHNDVFWDGCTKGLVGEFVVNEKRPGDQAHPDVSILSGDRFVVVWDGQVGQEGRGVFARLFTDRAVPEVFDIAVDPECGLKQAWPRVADVGEGGFVVVWTEYSSARKGDLKLRSFSSAGIPAGSAKTINQFIDFTQEKPDIARLADGRFIVTWVTFGQVGTNFDVVGRLLDDQGIPSGDEFIVNEHQDGNQDQIAVAALSSGGYVAIWHSSGQDGSLSGVFGRCFSSRGEPLNREFQVNDYSHGVQWMPAVAALAEDGFVVAWTGEGEGDDSGIFARRFGAGGLPSGKGVLVNQHTGGDQWEPAVAGFSDGRFMVAWESWIDQHEEGELILQFFNADGSESKPEFQLNRETYDGQGDPSLAVFADGRLLVAWYSFLQDGDERGIMAHLLTGKGERLRVGK
jgi:hypothetical protein